MADLLAASCPACDAWASDNRSGECRLGCKDCTARQIARGSAAWKALRAITNTELDDALAKAFPEDIESGRRLVWAWTKRVGARK